MGKKNLMDDVYSAIASHCSEDISLSLDAMPKENGIAEECIILKRKNESIGKVYRKEQIMDLAEKGNSAAQIAENIFDDYCEGGWVKFDEQELLGWMTMKDRVYPRLINSDKNREKLEQMPHREFLDLSLVYYAEITDKHSDMHGIMHINDELCHIWGVDEELIYHTALSNLQIHKPPVFQDIVHCICMAMSKCEKDDFLRKFEGTPKKDRMYVLSAGEKRFGAVYMLLPSVLEFIKSFLGTDFYILPSSVNDLIVLRKTVSMGANELQRLVQTVNTTTLSEGDVLSNSVYLYTDGHVEKVA